MDRIYEYFSISSKSSASTCIIIENEENHTKYIDSMSKDSFIILKYFHIFHSSLFKIKKSVMGKVLKHSKIKATVGE